MVQILDSTLREGEQTPGIYFSPETKLLIAQLLDQIGIDIIEAGNPAVSPEISASIARIVNAGLNANIGAHSLLATLLVNLLDMGESKSSWNLNYIKELYDLVSQYSQISISPHSPIVGKNAFTHYAGVHVKAIAQDEALYQSLNTGNLGSEIHLPIGMQSGRAAVELALKQIGREELLGNNFLINHILNEIKELAKRGTPIDIETELPSIVDKCVDKCIPPQIKTDWVYA